MEKYQFLTERLKNHSSMKQYIHRHTMSVITDIKRELTQLSVELSNDVTQFDKNVEVLYFDRGDFETELKFSGDSLVFAMHTNVFTFEDQHPIHRLEYVKSDSRRAYCGLIQIYNFLSDSIKYNRTNDYGYLVGRIFINSENNFFVEGKSSTDYPLANYAKQQLNPQILRDIIMSSMLFSIDFELLTPPYEQSSIITLQEKQFNHTASGMNTGKRLGFEFSAAKKSE